MVSSIQSQMEESENEIWETGNALLTFPSSREELLGLLHKAEMILYGIYQEPSQSTAKSLLPMMNALISEEIFKHSDGDIQVAVASCHNELTRITAPEYSYSDAVMKDIFKLFMIALKQLPRGTDINFMRAHRILNTMAKFRTCVMMWDLEIEDMVVEMFRIFFETIKLRKNEDLLEFMETIIVMMINDSDDISVELLTLLIESMKISTKNASLASWNLGETVFKKCAKKIKPYLMVARKKLNLNFSDYAEVIRTLCEDTSNGENVVVGENGKADAPSGVAVSCANPNSKAKKDKISPELNVQHETSLKAFNCARNIVDLKSRKSASTVKAANSTKNINSETDMITDPDAKAGNGAENPQSDLDSFSRQRRRGRKPNSLIRPEEGYEQPWEVGRVRSKRTYLDGRVFSKKIEKAESPSSKLIREELSEILVPVKPELNAREALSKNSAQMKSKPPISEPMEADSSLDSVPVKKKVKSSNDDIGENLVKTRIMVWWPMDKTFYTGTVESFDPETKTHKIIYDDDEEEHLDLKSERWEVFNEGRSRPIPEADTPLPAIDVHDESQSRKMKRKRTPASNQGVTRSSKRLKA